MSPKQRLAYAREIYQRDCTACHGEQGNGQGDGQAADSLRDYHGRPIVVPNLRWPRGMMGW
ncbi:MAG: c-type cytochrome [bacterium]